MADSTKAGTSKKKRRVVKKEAEKKAPPVKPYRPTAPGSGKLIDEMKAVTQDLVRVTPLNKVPPTVVVPTFFAGFNRATRVGGAPSRRIMIIHGPSGEGKSVFAAGLLTSAAIYGHIPLYVDAEHATDPDWWMKLNVPNWLPFYRPETYEEAYANINKAIMNFKKGKAAGTIDKNRHLVIVIDTINKLAPKEEIEKFGKETIKRGYPLRAMYNNRWLDVLTPICGVNDILFVVIAQERRDATVEDGQYVKEYTKWKTKGGTGLKYDSSLVVRITESTALKEDIGGQKIEVGSGHKGFVIKNKVGFCHEGFTFYTISVDGGENPVGFDYARELADECKHMGLIVKEGQNFRLDDDGELRAEKGLKAIRMALRNDESLAKRMLERLRQMTLEGKLPE